MLSPSVSGSLREERCLSYNKGHVCCHRTGTHALGFIYFPLDFNFGRRHRSTGGKANWNELSQCCYAACFSGQNSQDKTNPFISTMLAFLGVSVSFLFEARSWINWASSLFVGEVCDKPAVCCLHGGCVCTPEVKTSGGVRAGKLLAGVCPCCLLTSLRCAHAGDAQAVLEIQSVLPPPPSRGILMVAFCLTPCLAEGLWKKRFEKSELGAEREV